jgi:tetratricopeptide (TPR) repeat protein
MSNSIQHVGKRPASPEFETSAPKRQNTRFNTMDASDDPTAEKVEKINFEQRVTPSSPSSSDSSEQSSDDSEVPTATMRPIPVLYSDERVAAAHHLSLLCAKDPNDLNANPSLHYHLGCFHFKIGEISNALDHLCQVNTCHPNYENIQLFLGECYLTDGYYFEAALHLGKVPKSHPKYLEAQLLLGDCYLGQNQIEKGRYVKAHAYFEMKNCKKALHHFSWIVNSPYQDSEEINYWMGCCHFHLSDTSGAIEHLNQVSKSHPKFYQAQYILGCSYFLGDTPNKLQESFQVFKEIPSTHPRFADAQVMLACILQNQRKWSESISHLKVALESKFASDENISHANFLYGKAMYYENDYVHAIEHLNKFNILTKNDDTDEVVSNMREARDFLGKCYYELGKYDKAVKYFNINVELIPFYREERQESCYYSAVCLEKLGKSAEAVKLLNHAAGLTGQYLNEVQNMLQELR